MNTDPMTARQGDEIIRLLKDILYELKGIAKDSSSIESEVKFEISKIRKTIEKLPT